MVRYAHEVIKRPFLPSDLLAHGIPNGPVIRRLHLPERRKKEEEGAENDANAAAEKSQEEMDDEKEPLEIDATPIMRDSYNMVCYGLPNLVVTQLTKL